MCTNSMATTVIVNCKIKLKKVFKNIFFCLLIEPVPLTASSVYNFPVNMLLMDVDVVSVFIHINVISNKYSF